MDGNPTQKPKLEIGAQLIYNGHRAIVRAILRKNRLRRVEIEILDLPEAIYQTRYRYIGTKHFQTAVG